MEEPKQKHKLAWDFTLNLLGLLTILPLAPLINRVIPPILIGGWNADLLVAIVISFFLVRFIIWILKPLVIPAFLMVCIVLVFNLLTTNYNLKSMVNDYKKLVVSNWNNKDR